MGRWAECQVKTDPEAGEAVAALFMELGAGGVLWDQDASGPLVVTGYFPEDECLAQRLARLREGLAALPSFGLGSEPAHLEVAWVEEEDWAHGWKDHYHPLPVGERLLIQPSWEEAEPGDRLPIVLDPGMAFGTGRHPSTRLCLEALERYVRPGMVCADVGTGSGILAIAAALLGASRVVGVDVDPTAIRVAAANGERNGVAGSVVFAVGSAGEVQRHLGKARAQVVVANITAEVLMALRDDLVALLAPGGVLITSGIVLPKAPAVQAAFQERGLKLNESRQEGEWVALVFSAPRPAPPGR